MHDPGDQHTFITIFARLSEATAQLHQVYNRDVEAARLEVAHLRAVIAQISKDGHAKSNQERSLFELSIPGEREGDSSLDEEGLEEEANGMVAYEGTFNLSDPGGLSGQERLNAKRAEIENNLINEKGPSVQSANIDDDDDDDEAEMVNRVSVMFKSEDSVQDAKRESSGTNGIWDSGASANGELRGTPVSSLKSRYSRRSGNTRQSDFRDKIRLFTMRSPWMELQWSEAVSTWRANIEEEASLTFQTAGSYFSLGTMERDELSRLYWYILHPESRIRGIWVLACMFLLLYDIVMVPIEVCFDLDETDFSISVDIFAMAFWTADIFLNFITGIQRMDHVETRPRKIAIAYMKSWFFFDVCLVVPEWLMLMISTNVSSGDEFAVVRIVRYGRFVRLLRMARIVKLSKLIPLLRRLIYMFHLAKVYIQLTQAWMLLTMVLLAAIHVLSCFWYALGNELQDGWVKTNGLKSASVGRSYIASVHWTFSRVHGMKSQFTMVSPTEMLLDGLLIYVSLGVVAYYLGTVGAIATISANANTTSLWKLSMIYVKRYKISPQMSMKVAKFVESYGSFGANEAAAEDQQFLDALPTTLQNDLLFEVRVPFLMVMQFFKDMFSYSPRLVRQICTEALSGRVITDEEVVFAYGDACSGVLIMTSGEATYIGGPTATRAEMDNIIMKRQEMAPGLPFTSQGSTGQFGIEGTEAVVVQKYTVVSEQVFWTQWTHVGSLVASEECTALLLDPVGAANAIAEQPISVGHSVKYAKHFVRRLNDNRDVDDLTGFPGLTIDVVDTDLFQGNENDHFMFISHYKVEAGTEASLMRDLMVDMLRQDPNHPANDLRSPIFIDSEDLTDLAGLKQHVVQTYAFVLLLTPDVLSRPWCLVEIVTAIKHNLNIVPVEVQRPGSRYDYPDDKFYADILDGKFLPKSSVDILEQEGVGLADVEKAIRQIFLKIALPFSPHKTKAIREAELSDIIRRCEDD